MCEGSSNFILLSPTILRILKGSSLLTSSFSEGRTLLMSCGSATFLHISNEGMMTVKTSHYDCVIILFMDLFVIKSRS